MYKKWWFWLLLIVVIVFIYFILWLLRIVPMYQCVSTMGPNGPVNGCGWYYGFVVG